MLTDLNLCISKAYISSDGGWFMDGECFISRVCVCSVPRTIGSSLHCCPPVPPLHFPDGDPPCNGSVPCDRSEQQQVDGRFCYRRHQAGPLSLPIPWSGFCVGPLRPCDGSFTLQSHCSTLFRSVLRVRVDRLSATWTYLTVCCIFAVTRCPARFAPMRGTAVDFGEVQGEDCGCEIRRRSHRYRTYWN